MIVCHSHASPLAGHLQGLLITPIIASVILIVVCVLITAVLLCPLFLFTVFVMLIIDYHTHYWFLCLLLTFVLIINFYAH